MYLRCRPFRWPWQCADAIWSAFPNCSMTRASPEATERRHWATTRSVLPRRLPVWQSAQRLCKMYPLYVPTLLAVLMAITMRRPMEEVHGFLKATKRRDRASTRSDSINWTCLPLFQGYISSSNHWIRARVALITKGVWHIKLMRST